MTTDTAVATPVLDARQSLARRISVEPQQTTGDARSFRVTGLPGLTDSTTTAQLLATMEELHGILAVAGLSPKSVPTVEIIGADQVALFVVLMGAADSRDFLAHSLTAVLRVWIYQASEQLFRLSDA